RFRFDQEGARHVVDDERGEVRLAGHRTYRRKFREREAGDIVGIGMRIGHAVEYGLVGRSRYRGGPTELQGFLPPSGLLRSVFPLHSPGIACLLELAMTRAPVGRSNPDMARALPIL